MFRLRLPLVTLASAAGLLAALAQPAAAQEVPTLAKIKSTGTIALGHRESSIPFSYYDDKQQVVGYSHELMLKVVDAVKAELKLPALAIKLTPVTSQNRIPLVQNGTVDIECGSTTNNAARQKDVSFAVTTYVEEVRIAVKANSGITSINQLNGKNVATTTGTTSVQTLRKNERATGVDFKEVFGKDHADSFLLLESGRADAFVMDDYILAGLIARSKNPAGFKITGDGGGEWTVDCTANPPRLSSMPSDSRGPPRAAHRIRIRAAGCRHGVRTRDAGRHGQRGGAERAEHDGARAGRAARGGGGDVRGAGGEHRRDGACADGALGRGSRGGARVGGAGGADRVVAARARRAAGGRAGPL